MQQKLQFLLSADLLYLSASRLSICLSSHLLKQQTDAGLASKLWPTNSSPWSGSRKSGDSPGEFALSRNCIQRRCLNHYLFGASRGANLPYNVQSHSCSDNEKIICAFLNRECLEGIQTEVSPAFKQCSGLRS